jgi:hypothetical protein
MGSVIDYVECVNCKSEAMSDYYYKTGEEYMNCGNCGYHFSATIINREKRLDLLDESDWEIKELKKPYGAYRIKTHQSIATQCGSLSNKKQYDHLKSTIKDDVEIEFCTVSRLIRGKIVEETIVDNVEQRDDVVNPG